MPRERVLQPGVSVNIDTDRKNWKWKNVSKGTLFQIRAFTSMPALLTGGIGALMSVTTHISGTQSLPLDIIAGAISVTGVPASVVFYDAIKRSWRDQYLSDMKMERLANTKS